MGSRNYILRLLCACLISVPIFVSAQDQFSTRVKQFKEGSLKYEEWPELIYQAREKEEGALEKEIAGKYINDFLVKQPDGILFNKDNLTLLGNYYSLLTLESPAFNLYFNRGNLIDSIMRIQGYSQSFVDYVITKEMVSPAVEEAQKKGAKPEWKKISDRIGFRFGKRFSDPNLYGAKLAWFKKNKDWPNYTKWLVLQLKSKDLNSLEMDAGNVLMLNNSAWDIFQYSFSKKEIKTAIGWTDIILSKISSSAVLDTKANLLYKLGKREEAISLERKAHILLQQETKSTDVGFEKTIKRMEKGEKIWDESINEN